MSDRSRPESNRSRTESSRSRTGVGQESDRSRRCRAGVGGRVLPGGAPCAVYQPRWRPVCRVSALEASPCAVYQPRWRRAGPAGVGAAAQWSFNITWPRRCAPNEAVTIDDRYSRRHNGTVRRRRRRRRPLPASPSCRRGPEGGLRPVGGSGRVEAGCGGRGRGGAGRDTETSPPPPPPPPAGPVRLQRGTQSIRRVSHRGSTGQPPHPDITRPDPTMTRPNPTPDSTRPDPGQSTSNYTVHIPRLSTRPDPHGIFNSPSRVLFNSRLGLYTQFYTQPKQEQVGLPHSKNQRRRPPTPGQPATPQGPSRTRFLSRQSVRAVQQIAQTIPDSSARTGFICGCHLSRVGLDFDSRQLGRSDDALNSLGAAPR